VGSGGGTVQEFGGAQLHDTNLDCRRVIAQPQTGECSEQVPIGLHVGLLAQPTAGSAFVGWYLRDEAHSHACGQQTDCYVGVGKDHVTVVAEFDAVPDMPLTVLKSLHRPLSASLDGDSAGPKPLL
jgi:hypothetical protein